MSFNLIYRYVAACYPVGTGMCHNMVDLLQHYIAYAQNHSLIDGVDVSSEAMLSSKFGLKLHLRP